MGGHFPPTKPREFERCLLRLGFTRNYRVGQGDHVATYGFPGRKPTPPQIPLITIPHKMDDPDFRKVLVKQIMAFGFSKNEVMRACGKKA